MYIHGDDMIDVDTVYRLYRKYYEIMESTAADGFKILAKMMDWSKTPYHVNVEVVAGGSLIEVSVEDAKGNVEYLTHAYRKDILTHGPGHYISGLIPALNRARNKFEKMVAIENELSGSAIKPDMGEY